MSFSDLKKRSKQSTEKLTAELSKISKGSESYKDERLWRPQTDKSGNGYAVVRFLPACEGEDIPWARVFSHAFKGKGGWFIENCPTTIGGKCPMCEINNELWNSGLESDKDTARAQKRKLSYFSNILVVSDPANPENEGKVFLYKYGKKIHDKIISAMQPEFEDEEPINPFDFWQGADFKLKIRQVAGFTNYDRSEFAAPSELFDGDDEKLEALWKTQYALSEFTSESNFKSYDDLKRRLEQVLGGSSVTKTAETVTADDFVRPTTSSEEASESSEVSDSSGDDGDDALSYFQKLANDD